MHNDMNDLDSVKTIDGFGPDHVQDLCMLVGEAAQIDPVEAVKLLLKGQATLDFKSGSSSQLNPEALLTPIKQFTILGGRVWLMAVFDEENVNLSFPRYFRDEILSDVDRTNLKLASPFTVLQTTLGYFDLKRETTLGNIRSEMPTFSAFPTTDLFLAIFGLLYQEQGEGGEGNLQNNGRGNHFLVKTTNGLYEVRVYRVNDEEPRGWFCDSLPYREENLRSIGTRFFSATVV